MGAVAAANKSMQWVVNVVMGLGCFVATFCTILVFMRKHEEGIKSWSAFWVALVIDKGLGMLMDGQLDQIIPFSFALKLARFLILWMYIALIFGDTILTKIENITGARLRGTRNF